jgi:hypothetical protein
VRAPNGATIRNAHPLPLPAAGLLLPTAAELLALALAVWTGLEDGLGLVVVLATGAGGGGGGGGGAVVGGAVVGGGGAGTDET